MIRPRPFDPARHAIGIFSPASAVIFQFPGRYQRSENAIGKLGWKMRLAPSAGLKEVPLAQVRADEIHDFLRDEEVGMLMAATGGYGSNEILDYLDIDLLRKHPKPIVGFSDTTALLLGISARTDQVTFHGPALLPSFGDLPGPAPAMVSSLLAATTGTGALGDLLPPPSYSDEFLFWGSQDDRPPKELPHDGWNILSPGTAEGPLVGGNLDTLISQLATAWMPRLDGVILFIEAAFCSLSKIVRDLTVLGQAGVFNGIAGLIVGRSFRLSETNEDEFSAAIAAVAKRYKFPAIGMVDIGHTSPILTLPIGVRARIQADPVSTRITILEAAVE